MGRLVKFLIALALTVILIFIVFKVSPNFRYFAIPVGDTTQRHYLVISLETGRGILTSHAQYTTPNDVKECGYSADSTKFAAVYHYGDMNSHTWIGVWSTLNGKFLYSVTKRGFTTNLSGVFD